MDLEVPRSNRGGGTIPPFMYDLSAFPGGVQAELFLGLPNRAPVQKNIENLGPYEEPFAVARVHSKVRLRV